MNSQIQYTHLGDSVTFYQATETPIHPSSNNGIINFKGHSLKKIDQPSRVSTCISCNKPLATQRVNTDNILKCIQPNCYFSCKETEISATQNSNNVLTIQQKQWLNKDKANEAAQWLEFNIKRQIAEQLYTMMAVDGFDKNNPEFTTNKIAENITIETNIKLKEGYVENLLLNTNPQQQCPYLNSILAQSMQTPQEIITTRGVNIIKKLITDIMKQQDININFRDDGNVFHLHGDIVDTRNIPYIMVYDLKYLVDHYDTTFLAVSSLLQEVEFDKILIKLSRIYPQAFDKNSAVFIDTWDWNEQTITFGYKIVFPFDTNENNILDQRTIGIDSFCSIENMIFNFDLLKAILNATPNLSYESLFQVNVFSGFGRPLGEQTAPSGLLSPSMFACLPV